MTVAPLEAIFLAVSLPTPADEPVIIIILSERSTLYVLLGPALVLEYTIPIKTITTTRKMMRFRIINNIFNKLISFSLNIFIDFNFPIVIIFSVILTLYNTETNLSHEICPVDMHD